MFYKTIRKNFIKDDLIITYSNPSIQTFNYGKFCKNKSDILYFYYDIQVLYKGKILLEYRTHDFPKVNRLPEAIDELLDDKNYVLEYEVGEIDSYHRFDYFKRIKHIEIYEMEYGYIFEAEKCVYKQQDDKDYSTQIYYTMEIFSPKQISNRWYDKYGEVCTSIRIKMTEDELMKLKQTVKNFMKEAIDIYNEYELEDETK